MVPFDDTLLLGWAKTGPQDPDAGTHDWSYPFDLCSSMYGTGTLMSFLQEVARSEASKADAQEAKIHASA